MPRGKSSHDQNILAMALIGYESEKKRIDEQIAEIRAKLRTGKTANVASANTETAKPRKRRKLSAAARKRISAAQKARWAEHRKASKGE